MMLLIQSFSNWSTDPVWLSDKTSLVGRRYLISSEKVYWNNNIRF